MMSGHVQHCCRRILRDVNFTLRQDNAVDFRAFGCIDRSEFAQILRRTVREKPDAILGKCAANLHRCRDRRAEAVRLREGG